MAKIRNKKTGVVIEVNDKDLHQYGLGRKKLPKALFGIKQHGDLEAMYNQGYDEDVVDPFAPMDYSDLPMLQSNIGFQGLINEKNNGFPLSDSPYSTLKRPQEQTYQMDKLPTQLIPEQQAPQFRPLSEDTENTKSGFNWKNGINIVSKSNEITKQGQMATKGFLNNIINNSLTNRENFRNATQFGQSVYADAENRPQGQIYGKDIRGGNALFANGGMNIKEIGGQGEPNVEIEGKEHVLLPDGMSQTVQGDSHAEGGIPLNLAPGSMIFSEKLKDPTTGKSYAKLAKPFETKKDVNRQIDKRADDLQKKTADLNIKFKENKLKALFEVQEQNKLQGSHGKKVQMEAIQSLQQEQQPEQEQNQQPIAKYGMKLSKFDVGGVNYEALLNVEEQLGVLKNGIPSSTGYNDKSIHQLDSLMIERIKNTIGEDTWNKLPDNLKTQVFSFAFNNGVEKKNWLTGLAQAIDPTITDRTKLSETDAIFIIKSNIGKINDNVYNNYINKVLPSQYNSIASANNKQEENKKLWQFRADNINQFLQNSNNQTPVTQQITNQNTFNTGYNPNVLDPSLTRLSDSKAGLRNNYLPYQPGQEPYVYGQDLNRWVDDFTQRTGIPVDKTEQGLANIRTYQSLAHPGLVKDYKINFARGNQDAYNEFTKQKGYKKGATPTEESNNFYNWSVKNNKLGQDYIDKGKPGHEYFRTEKLPFTKEEFFDASGSPKDKDWQLVESNGKKYYVDRSAYASSGNPELDKKRGLPPITYYELDGENLKSTTKQPTSDPVKPIDYKFPQRKQEDSFQMPNFNMGIPLPYNEKTTPLNYYKIQPEFIDPRYLNVQPQLNDITRGVRTVQNNLGDRSTSAIGNSLQAQINAYNQENQVYGNKYNYDKGQDSQAQQSNVQTEMNTRLSNQNSWYNQLEDPIRARSSAKNKQFKENQQRGLENWNEQMAFNNNSNYINDIFYNPKNIDNINWVANLNPAYIKKAKESKWDDEIEKEQYIKQKKAELGIAKNGGKVRIKPKIKLK